MIHCTAPGCAGTVEDGYCVVCGMPPTPSPPPSAGAVPAPDACARPGCTGTVQDGYCDVCGMPPAVAAQPAPAPPPQAAPASNACVRPGCTGTIEDGYCDVCGLPPAQAQEQPKAPDFPHAHSGSVPSGSAHSGSVHSGSFATSGSTRTGSTRTGSARSSGRRGMLGANLVEVPRIPYRDPASAVLQNPEVPEGRRSCSNCGEPVGRSREGRPGRTEGFCPKCGAAFSYTPKLRPGDLVSNQYEVLGCLAHGGLGWIYLARDKNVSDRWVVLKGLLNTGDAGSQALAAAERTFLAEVEHPNIVKIYNFVQYGGDDYIVMEYVGGQSLKDILLHHRNQLGQDALPLGQAIAYALEVLQAFGYLHARGLVYCDFKPDNVIQSEEQLRLIDMGAVRRVDDPDGDIYGTVGYQAPEVADTGPTVASDLYTVGRALAVMSFSFKGYMSTYVDGLPPRAEIPVLARFESYDRFLRRATHKDPAQRFQDAAEMAEQLTGVLREVLAAEDGVPRPAMSGLFGPERFAPGSVSDDDERALPPVLPRAAAAALPVPLADGADPAAGFLAGLTALEPAQLAAAVESAPQRTPEITLALARVRVELGDFDAANALLDQAAADLPGDWRIDWYRAVAALAAERFGDAEALFDRLYGLLPGEAAPKLALAYCREQRAPRDAARLYETVWRTDQGYINAAFGLARVYLEAGDHTAAVAVLDSVPPVSIRYVPAQVAAVVTAVRRRPAAELSPAELTATGDRLAGLGLEGRRRDELAVSVLWAALDWVQRAGGPEPNGTVLGVPFAEARLRRELETTYRALARHTQDREDRRLLIDAANAVRPRTLL